MCYSRVTMLTEEIERLSDVLTNKGEQADMFQMMIDQLQSQNNQHKVEVTSTVRLKYIKLNTLSREFDAALETIKDKTVEIDELKSSLHRVTEITLKEKDQKLIELVDELQKISFIIDDKDNELMSAKEQFVRKTQEVSEANQQMFHLENAVKVVKDEKLKYIHEYQVKEQQLQEANQTIQELVVIKQNYE